MCSSARGKQQVQGWQQRPWKAVSSEIVVIIGALPSQAFCEIVQRRPVKVEERNAKTSCQVAQKY